MIFVDIKKTIATPELCYRAQRTYAVTEDVAAEWCRKGIAKRTRKPPEHIAQLFARLEAGAGESCLYLPFLSEFGHEVMSHMRLVHFAKAARKVVCCRPGNEALYPSADEYVTDWVDPLTDVNRATAEPSSDLGDFSAIIARFPGHQVIKSGGLTREQALWAIEPTKRIRFKPKERGLKVDVLLGVRRRELAPERNFQHWQVIADAITRAGLTFAVVGNRATSFDLPGQVLHTGDLDTDATLELMQKCQLWVSTDTGSSHLASTVGCRMLLFHNLGKQQSYIPRMEEVNPGRIDFVASGWSNPERVVDRIFKLLQVNRA